jgi:hypothetical protein
VTGRIYYRLYDDPAKLDHPSNTSLMISNNRIDVSGDVVKVVDIEGQILNGDMMHYNIGMNSEKDSDFADEEEGDTNFDEFEYEVDDHPSQMDFAVEDDWDDDGLHSSDDLEDVGSDTVEQFDDKDG